MLPSFVDKSKLPHRPGVYIYKDKSGKILYVGKAVDLYHRVASYFSGHQEAKTAVLVEDIKGLETIEVASEIEALILEADLIKKYLPPFNIKLTDDKDYLYIKITKENFPEVLTARKTELSDAKTYFGPFPSSRTVNLTLKKLRRIFPWCDGKYQRLKKQNPCFYYHLSLCPGVCVGKISKEEYNKIIRRFVKFMEGKKEEVLKDLEKEMEKAANNLDFEKAQAIKKTIEGIEYLTRANNTQVYLENPNFIGDQNKQALEALKSDLNLRKLPERIECYDVSNTGGQQATGSLVVLTGGEIDKKWYRKFKICQNPEKPNDVGMMREILQRRMKHKEWPLPDLILVDGGRGQAKIVKLEVRSWKLDIPVFGLAKRMEWLYDPEKEIIRLSRASLSLRILQKVRDEAHRFALNYHKKLRGKKFLTVV